MSKHRSRRLTKKQSQEAFDAMTRRTAPYINALRSTAPSSPQANLSRGKHSLSEAFSKKLPLSFLTRSNRDRYYLGKLKQENPTVITRVLSLALSNPSAAMRLAGPPHRGYATISTAIPMPYAGSLQSELRWTSHLLISFAAHINDFLARKRIFEESILLSDLSRAEAQLNDILDRFGLSLWALQALLLLAEYKGGLEANREQLLIVRNTVTDPLTSLLATYYSQRAERNISADTYSSAVSALLTAPLESESTTLIAYLCFKLRFYSPMDYTSTDLGMILAWEQDYSIIDRYLTLVRLLQLLTALHSRKHHSDSISQLVTLLSNHIVDPSLMQLHFHHVPTTPLSPRPPFDDVFSALHSYTVGDYETAYQQSSSALSKSPCCFPFYLICTLSLLALQRPFPASSTPSPIYKTLLFHLYNVLSRNQHTPESISALTKFFYALDSFAISGQLYTFGLAVSHSYSPFRLPTLEALSAELPTPRSCHGYNRNSDALTLLSGLRSLKPTNASVLLFSYLYGESSHASQHEALLTTLPPERQAKYRGLRLEALGSLREAISQYEGARTLAAANMPAHVFAITRLYDLYLTTGKLPQCVNLVIETYLTTPHALLGLSFHPLLKAYYEAGGIAYDASLPWVILHYVVHHNDPPSVRSRVLFRLYDAFLRSRGLERPTDLIPEVLSCVSPALLFFLSRICKPDVMDSSLAFDSTHALEDERIALCQRLVHLDPPNAPTYTAEIADIMQRRVIHQAIARFEQGKIYVDTAGLLRSIDTPFRARYERFLQLRAMTPELRQELLVIGSEDKKIFFIIRDASYEVFRALFSDIRTRFVSSTEYGLDSYLSVRIRHGTLSGQIRSEFEKYHLITRKETAKGDYGSNAYWRPQLVQYGEETALATDDAFKRFSARVDTTIATVKDKWIQVKSERDKKEGFFDYAFSDSQLEEVYYRLAPDIACDAFVQAIVAVLWDHTRSILTNIRSALTVDLEDQLRAALTDLETELSGIAPHLRGSDLINAVAACRTSVHYALNAVAAWFRISEETSLPEYDFRTAVDTSVAIINRIYPTLALAPTVTITDIGRCNGMSFSPFIDILLILLDNVVKHGHPTDRSVQVQGRKRGEAIELSVISAISPDVDVEALNGTLVMLQQRWASTEMAPVVQKEGGSGFFKLKKLLQYDLRSRDAKVSCLITESRQFVVTIRATVEGLGTNENCRN